MKPNTNLLLFLAILLFSSQLFADQITPRVAKKVAENFYCINHPENNPGEVVAMLAEKRISNGQTLLYIYNIDEAGFVIVSGWDGVIPVAGYSDIGVFPGTEQNQPEAFISMLNIFEKQVAEAIAMDLKPTAEISNVWDKLMSPLQQPDGNRSVYPLLSTTWNQSCYYNELCPEDDNSPYGYCGHVPAGCVALAMAQVMKFWDYPAMGSGSHTYNASPYGWQSADFGNTTYDWNGMPNSIGSSNPAVATLIYHCAVSVEMQFSPYGSGASTVDAVNALKNYFNYDPQSQYYSKSSYSDEAWETMIREELDLGRPVIYRGQGSGGHAWVCDGYSADDYFHMNWGWGGYANGYFYLSNLNPAGQDFNYYQGAIMKIVPEEATVEPPGNLVAEVNGNNIDLSWDEPVVPKWLHWDDGSTSGVVLGSFTAAARWSPDDLASVNGLYITKVSAFLGNALADYKIKIWTGENAANLVLIQDVTNVAENSWNLIELNEAVQIDASEELWVGVSVINQFASNHAMGHDGGPAVTGYGDLISFDGTNWSTLTEYGWSYNWNIQTFVNTSPDGKNMATTLQNKTFKNKPTGRLVSNPLYTETKTINPMARNLIGYNVYRNGLKLNESIVPGLFYTDENVQPGTYEYFVTAVYNAGESDPSNIVTVTSGLTTSDFQLTAGWNSISSNLIPVDPDLEVICNPVVNDMVIMQTLDGQYYPGMNINTLGDWNIENGYIIKVNQPCVLPFSGLTGTNQILTLQNGWNLIPVLSACEVNTEELFAEISGYVIIVKDAAGSGVYWPDKSVNTLSVLEPGKAYLVKISGSGSITFPSCE